MANELWNWVFELPLELAKFGSWLIEPLPYINISPLAFFGFGGLTAIVAILLIRLFVGG